MALWRGFPDNLDIAERDILRAFIAALKDVSGPLMGPALFRLAVRKMDVSGDAISMTASPSDVYRIMTELCDRLGIPNDDTMELIERVIAARDEKYKNEAASPPEAGTATGARKVHKAGS